MNQLFAPCRIGGVSIPSRILRGAMHDGMADAQGRPTADMCARFAALAAGGVGGIITGGIAVAPEGRGDAYRPLVLQSEADADAYRPLCDAAHANGVPIFAQLSHAGAQTRLNPCGPCALKDPLYPGARRLHELLGSEIVALVRRFAQAAVNARRAGFDGVELQAAHGGLLSGFLSPLTNFRDDDYGGDALRRARMAVECVRLVKAMAGADFPVIVKINGSERTPGGVRASDAAQTAVLLAQAGADALEISCGLHREGLQTARGEFPLDDFFREEPALRAIPRFLQNAYGARLRRMYQSAAPWTMYNLPALHAVAEKTDVPLILTGGVHTLADMEAALRAGAQFVSLARPLLAQPDLPAALRDGRTQAARCTQCNRCLAGLHTSQTVCRAFSAYGSGSYTQPNERRN